ncbi:MULTISPECIES: DUF4407 domain-containing protein [Pseudofrankia]|uniref:DUF4407 domain-containing protein n=1 Tax=Pseudofrankia TaxID=2994363 RepID=UPI000234DC04|nr:MULTISPECIES: DUF4407 domain-containing protein [Pseudofrankia]OHV39891.1 hypothetical protein BCD49_09895 [Pseudofrankia sp. EUN1h]
MTGAGPLIGAPFRAMGRFMLWLSTANLEVLERFPSDRPKYIGLGSSVFITSSVAAVSASFALHMGLKLPVAICVIAGFLWGCAILGFDRWLLATAGRGNLLLLLPRAGLAVLIGIVVSTPFVLQMFQPEISSEINFIHAEREAAFIQKSSTDQRGARIDALEKQDAAFKKQLQDLGKPFNEDDYEPVRTAKADLKKAQDDFTTADNNYTCEYLGRSDCGSPIGASGKPGDGPYLQQLSGIRDRAQTALTTAQGKYTTAHDNALAAYNSSTGTERPSITANITRVETELRTLRTAVDADTKRFRDQNADDTGLLIRIEALDRLTSERPSMRTAHLLLLLFITAIECLPILFKLFMSLGKKNKYEEALEIEEREHLAISQAQSRQKRAAALIYDQDALREAQAARDRRDAAIEELANKTIDSQVKLAEDALDRWTQEQRRRIQRDPGEYLANGPTPAPTLLPPSQRQPPENWEDARNGAGGRAGMDDLRRREWPPPRRDEQPRRGAERPVAPADGRPGPARPAGDAPGFVPRVPATEPNRAEPNGAGGRATRGAEGGGRQRPAGPGPVPADAARADRARPDATRADAARADQARPAGPVPPGQARRDRSADPTEGGFDEGPDLW